MGDASCEASKSNITPCKDEVIYATQKETVVSCTAAQWICAADMECSTALDWYNNLCQGMFKGKGCNDRYSTYDCEISKLEVDKCYINRVN